MFKQWNVHVVVFLIYPSDNIRLYHYHLLCFILFWKLFCCKLKWPDGLWINKLELEHEDTESPMSSSVASVPFANLTHMTLLLAERKIQHQTLINLVNTAMFDTDETCCPWYFYLKNSTPIPPSSSLPKKRFPIPVTVDKCRAWHFQLGHIFMSWYSKKKLHCERSKVSGLKKIN